MGLRFISDTPYPETVEQTILTCCETIFVLFDQIYSHCLFIFSTSTSSFSELLVYKYGLSVNRLKVIKYG